MTTSNNIPGGPHPEDLLVPYALDALPQTDALQVESHLESCSQCREEAAQLRQTTASLSQAVEPLTPPPALASRLMAAVGRSQPKAINPAPFARAFGFRSLWPKTLSPAAAAIVLVLAVSLMANVWYFSRVNRLNEENSNLTARVLQFPPNDSELLEYLQQKQLASYLLANPSYDPLMLEAPDGGDPQGVLLLGEDSRHAILLVSGMPGQPLPTSYQVWLLRSDERVRMGEVQVDSSGWGTMSLYYPPESVLRFDKVVLSRDGMASGEAASRDMVLEGSFASLKSSK
jgi:hypothetical protein